MADDEGMPKPGNPDSVRCRHCHAPRLRHHNAWLCPYCDLTPVPGGGGAPFRPNPTTEGPHDEAV